MQHEHHVCTQLHGGLLTHHILLLRLSPTEATDENTGIALPSGVTCAVQHCRAASAVGRRSGAAQQVRIDRLLVGAHGCARHRLDGRLRLHLWHSGGGGATNVRCRPPLEEQRPCIHGRAVDTRHDQALGRLDRAVRKTDNQEGNAARASQTRAWSSSICLKAACFWRWRSRSCRSSSLSACAVPPAAAHTAAMPSIA